MNTGISNEELLEQMNENFTNNPQIMTDRAFGGMLARLPVIRNNVKIQDVSRKKTSYFDKDICEEVEDHQMKNLSSKAILAVDKNLVDKMEQHNLHVNDQSLTYASESFIGHSLKHKNIGELQLKNVGDDLFKGSQTWQSLGEFERQEIQKASQLIYEIMNKNILIVLFSSLQDLGFTLSKTIKYRDGNFIVNKITIKRDIFLQIVRFFTNQIQTDHNTILRLAKYIDLSEITLHDELEKNFWDKSALVKGNTEHEQEFINGFQ